MSYDDHTDCAFCRRHSVDCWCYSTNLWADEAKGDKSAWCHRPDEPAAHVPAAPWGQRMDAAYEALDRAFLDAKPIEARARVIAANTEPLPPLVRLLGPAPLADEERDALIRRWLEAHSGTRNAHRVKYLGRHPLPWWKRAYYQVRRWLA